MDEQALADLRYALESDLVERKSSAAEADKIREAICAYANDLPDHRRPGVIFVGLRDDGTCADLTPLAQEARKPMFALRVADGAIGAHAHAVEAARRDFEALAREIGRRIGGQGEHGLRKVDDVRAAARPRRELLCSNSADRGGPEGGDPGAW